RKQMSVLLNDVIAGAPPFTILMLEIDNLEQLRDVLDQRAGDDLLREVSGRLAEVVSAHAITGQFEDGRFVVVAPRTTTREGAERLADRIRTRMFSPVKAGGRRLHLTVSTGIVVADGSQNAVAALKAARLALRSARSGGRSQRAIYEADIGVGIAERIALEQDLYIALRKEQMEVHYQPIVAIETGRIAGFEALVRWNRPGSGFVSPSRFIPRAEENGMIVELGEWVLQKACQQARVWANEGHGDLFISVNLSARQLLEPKLIERVRKARHRAGIPARSIKLELTESAFIDDPERLGSILQTLHFMGFRLALDDFGTGYSSLSYLHSMPFDTLKVDQSFVGTLGTGDRRREALVANIVGMGRGLGMKVVAEGVETNFQLEALRELGCEYAQGWLYARAMPPEQASEMLANQPDPGKVIDIMQTSGSLASVQEPPDQWADEQQAQKTPKRTPTGH
ncbi:MAG: diguanylate cyclase (GGDEF)-like protein, partial [Myxococcota bacterium]